MLEIVLALGVPLVAGFVLTLLRAIALQKPLSLETSQDVALDMTFLALGAAASVFHNAKLQQRFGDATPGLAVLIVLDLFVAALLLYLRRFYPRVTNGQAAINLVLGTLPITTVAVVIYMSR